MDNNYDLIILGAGPAGLSAGIYAGRAGLSTLIIEKGTPGGQILLTSEIENYPGGNALYPESGAELTERMRAQAESFGARIASDEIVTADIAGPEKILMGASGSKYAAKALIIAMGAAHRRIGCAGEERFIGSGIAYCALCDGRFFEGLEVVAVGGGESALEEARYLAGIARHVTLVHRRDTFRASMRAIERAKATPNMSFIMNSTVESVDGDDVLTSITLRDVGTKERTVLKATEQDGMIGLFGFVGMDPQTKLFEASALKLSGGYIAAGEDTHTNIDGVFAAGDIRTKPLRQVVTAAADGAVAAGEASRYIDALGARRASA